MRSAHLRKGCIKCPPLENTIRGLGHSTVLHPLARTRIEGHKGASADIGTGPSDSDRKK